MIERAGCRAEDLGQDADDGTLDALRERYALRASVIKALAHPSRLMMVEALAGGERCVCELTDLVGSDISTVSKHLSILKQIGILEDRKDGLWVHYRLRCPCILEFLGCIDTVLGETHPRNAGPANEARRPIKTGGRQ